MADNYSFDVVSRIDMQEMKNCGGNLVTILLAPFCKCCDVTWIGQSVNLALINLAVLFHGNPSLVSLFVVDLQKRGRVVWLSLR